jgi:hypothetical protein
MSRRVGIAISGVTIAALVCAVVAGCGGKEESAAVEPVTRPATDDTAGQPGVAATQAPRMANAVATGAGAAVDLQYELAPRPEVGQPFEIELSLIPGVPADTLDVQLNATSGLRVTSTETIRFEGVQAGERYASKAMVIGDAPGNTGASRYAHILDPGGDRHCTTGPRRSSGANDRRTGSADRACTGPRVGRDRDLRQAPVARLMSIPKHFHKFEAQSSRVI